MRLMWRTIDKEEATKDPSCIRAMIDAIINGDKVDVEATKDPPIGLYQSPYVVLSEDPIDDEGSLKDTIDAMLDDKDMYFNLFLFGSRDEAKD